MKLLDHFYKPNTFDCHTFVFDEKQGEFNTMLALSEDGYAFSQWTSGLYDPDGENDHLGTRVPIHELGTTVLNAFFSRLSVPNDWEELHHLVEEMVASDEPEEPSVADRMDALLRELRDTGELLPRKQRNERSL